MFNGLEAKDGAEHLMTAVKYLGSLETSKALQNRLVRKAKNILTAGVLVALSVAIIHLDFYELIQRHDMHIDLVTVATKLDQDECIAAYVYLQLDRTSPDITKDCAGLLEYATGNGQRIKDEKWIDYGHWRYSANHMVDSLKWVYPVGVLFFVLFPVLMGIYHFWHANQFVKKNPNLFPDKEIEKAFEKTNKIPVVDTILETKYSWEYGSRTVLILNGVVFMLIIIFVVFCWNEPKVKMTRAPLKLMLFATINAIYAYYQFFGETNEYWVFVKTDKKMPVTKEEEVSEDQEEGANKDGEEGVNKDEEQLPA